MTASATSEPGTASFEGNLTIISAPPGQAVGMQRQSDCSLKLFTASYTIGLTSPTLEILTETPNHERTLHDLAGLTTTAGTFAAGCVEATAGIGSRRAAYLGTNPDLYLFAASGYDSSADSNALFYATVDKASQTVHTFESDVSLPGIWALAPGDLNGDGLADVIGIDYFDSAAIDVWLARADGTVSGPTAYALPAGDRTLAAVTTDVNGDSKLDVVVATGDSVSNEQYVSVLLGQGNGTLAAPQSMTVPPPSVSGVIGSTAAQIVNLVAVDLRNSGHPDVVASNGLVLLNHDGDGTFIVGDWAFPPTLSTSAYGPNVAAGDFNNDDKPDLAVNDGLTIAIHTGDGAGRFIAGKAYASITDVGYMSASDLDGDGNVDLYVGMANGGFFGGDQFLVDQAYALMGNGDGSFRGGPATPFVYTGTNLADLDGDGNVDAVGVNSDLSFTSYIGDGAGNFAARSTLDVSPLTLYGRDYNLQDLDSLALGDINDDGHADLLFLGKNLVVRPPVGFDTPGIVVALGDGQGGFSAPGFVASGHFVPDDNVDLGPKLTNLRLFDANNDGKADLVFSYSVSDATTNRYYVGVAVQVGHGDGTFGDAQTLVFYDDTVATTQTFTVAAIADLDTDSTPDLLVMAPTTTFNTDVGQYEYELQVALGNGDGTFAPPTAVPTNDVLLKDLYAGMQYAPIAVVDMDGDAEPDLVTLGASATGSLQVAIARGNGNGTFQAANKTTYSAAYLGQGLGAGDLNGDDKPDVFIGGPFGPPDSAVTFGNGDGTLQPITGSSSGTVGNELVYLTTGGATIATDFNGDGRADVLSGRTLLLAQAASTTPPDFAPTASTLSGTVAAGASAQITITLTPSGGFSGDIALSCSGLPTAASCAFNPASLTVDATPASAALTISTTARTAQLDQPAGSNPLNPWVPGGAMLAGVLAPLAAIRRRSSTRRQVWRVALVLMAVVLVYSCGGGDGGNGGGGGAPPPLPPPTGTPAGTYPITIDATSGGTSHTLTYTLTVT